MDHRSKHCEAKTLLLVVALMATTSVVLQISKLPHPTALWFPFWGIVVLRHEASNDKMHTVEPFPRSGREHLSTISFYPDNGAADQAMSIEPEMIAPIDSVMSNQTQVRSLDLPSRSYVSRPSDHSDPLPEIAAGKTNIADLNHLSEQSNIFLTQSIMDDCGISLATKERSIGENCHMLKKERNTPKVISVSEGSHTSIAKKEVQPMRPLQGLLYVKHELKNVHLVMGDPDLHPPLFRNISLFKRSYELMEKILKVYIYPDGKMPVFHKPPLKGIYASEGWFMKLMKENRQFVVKEPEKAHLFYLPYSSHQLELALYDPESHNMQSLSFYLRDYVRMIASKYPFWNRTRGADHFLVACHDWGPYTTREHEELHHNTIKALCNADLSEGVFIRGKDVSLPETTIHNPRRPLRELGGKPISERTILAFFAGNMHGRVRPMLVKHWRDKDEEMRIYGPLPNRVSKRMSYIQHMKSSKYCICPMGYEVNSPRMVEAIYYECVPVIIADNFVPPFDDVLDWNAFSVTVAEKDIPKLKDILIAIPSSKYIDMQMNVKKVQKHFMWHRKPVKYDIFYMILHSIWFNRLNQIKS